MTCSLKMLSSQHKQMERYSMFLGRKNQYSENDCMTKCSLQIQCDHCQITNGIFHRTRTKNFTIYIETQKILNSQAVLRKKNGAGGINLPDLRLHHQTTVIKTVIVLAQKQKYRPMEQGRKPRDKPTHLWAPYLWQRRQWYTVEKDSLFNK